MSENLDLSLTDHTILLLSDAHPIFGSAKGRGVGAVLLAFILIITLRPRPFLRRRWLIVPKRWRRGP